MINFDCTYLLTIDMLCNIIQIGGAQYDDSKFTR